MTASIGRELHVTVELAAAQDPAISFPGLTAVPRVASRPANSLAEWVAHGRVGVIEQFFESLKYEHLFRGYIGDGDALEVEVHRFRTIRCVRSATCTTKSPNKAPGPHDSNTARHIWTKAPK